jgi:hypothetical protein
MDYIESILVKFNGDTYEVELSFQRDESYEETNSKEFSLNYYESIFLNGESLLKAYKKEQRPFDIEYGCIRFDEQVLESIKDWWISKQPF